MMSSTALTDYPPVATKCINGNMDDLCHTAGGENAPLSSSCADLISHTAGPLPVTAMMSHSGFIPLRRHHSLFVLRTIGVSEYKTNGWVALWALACSFVVCYPNLNLEHSASTGRVRASLGALQKSGEIKPSGQTGLPPDWTPASDHRKSADRRPALHVQLPLDWTPGLERSLV